jgi:hypothetical protein
LIVPKEGRYIMPSWQTEITENNKEWFFLTKPILRLTQKK